MKQMRFVLIASLLFFTATNFSSQKKEQGSSIFAEFVASTPCSAGSKPVPGIPINADCELIKWNLTLYQDGAAKKPGTYKLHCVYGLPKQNSNGLTGGGKELEMQGKCTIVNGTATDPNAVVYQLQDDKTRKTISFLKLSDDLLHLLDEGKRLMIGSAAWSYTLNRIISK